MAVPRPRILPGEDTTATSKVVPGKKPGYLSMQWRVCLFSGRVERHVTEVKTTRVSDVRQKAKATARSLLDGSSTGSWRRDSKLSDYIERESIPAIERNQFPKPLRPNTQVRYVRCLALLADELRGMAIADATRPRQLNDALASIASKNGTATARQCGKVASKYVMRRLVTDEVLDHNPLRDLDLELPEHIARRKPQGGQALTPDERDRVIAFLIEYVPETLPQPKRGRYSAEQRTAIRQRAVDVTLLQADTGLRINEACRLTRADVDVDADPLTVSVTAEVSKTPCWIRAFQGVSASVFPSCPRRVTLSFSGRLPSLSAFGTLQTGKRRSRPFTMSWRMLSTSRCCTRSVLTFGAPP